MDADTGSSSESSRASRAQWALGVILIPLFAYVAFAFWQNGKQAQSTLTIRGRTPLTAESAVIQVPDDAAKPAAVTSVQLPQPPKEVVVHVVGAVEKPGVYRLSPEKRVDDAVNAAGGPTVAADVNAINLAATIEDGTRIEVPTRSEPTRTPPRPVQTSSPETRKTSPDSEKLTSGGSGSVNINTSDSQELQRLPGVGPAMADRILSHRKENGPFSDPEQLMDVSGIGEKKFAKMKPFVRVR